MRSVRVSVKNRGRAATAAAVAGFHAAVAWLVLAQPLAVPSAPAESIAVFDVIAVPPPPPPAPEPKRARTPKPEGAAAPANKRAKPKPVVAPKPVIELPPPPVLAAPVAGSDIAPAAGAAPLPGPGAGAGGEGAGLGSGGAGTGAGGGGSGAYWLKGRIKDSDYPRAASRAGVGGTVVAQFDVGADGRPRNCRVVRSSGHPDLDSTTCRLIEKRFRYKPARDATGRPVPDVAAWRQTWWLEERS